MYPAVNAGQITKQIPSNKKAMNTVLKINVQELDSKFVENLKKEYSDSELEIFVHDQMEPVPSFTYNDFWQTIGLLDWSEEGNDENTVEPVISALEQMPLANIYRFQDLLSEKLWYLDTRKRANVFLDDPEEEGYLSADDFLYARCAVVANGKQYYDDVLQHPEKMPKELTFEPLLFVASQAYKRKTGRDFMAQPSLSYETHSNKKAWAN